MNFTEYFSKIKRFILYVYLSFLYLSKIGLILSKRIGHCQRDDYNGDEIGYGNPEDIVTHSVDTECNISFGCNMLIFIIGATVEMKGPTDLEIYRIARELSRTGRTIYEKASGEIKRILGSQFIRSLDSVGANIAECYGRFHYLDSIRFYYTARGSLLESMHRIELLNERNVITDSESKKLIITCETLSVKLNNFISRTKQLTLTKIIKS